MASLGRHNLEPTVDGSGSFSPLNERRYSAADKLLMGSVGFLGNKAMKV